MGELVMAFGTEALFWAARRPGKPLLTESLYRAWLEKFPEAGGVFRIVPDKLAGFQPAILIDDGQPPQPEPGWEALLAKEVEQGLRKKYKALDGLAAQRQLKARQKLALLERFLNQSGETMAIERQERQACAKARRKAKQQPAWGDW
jgi:hypothetical protein